MTGTTRRELLKTTAAALGGAAVWTGASSSRARAEESITVTSLGGKWEQSIREDFIPLFKERTGADAKVVLGGPTQWMSQILSQPSKPALDEIDNSETLAYKLMDEHLAAKLTVDKVPNLADIPELFRKPWDDYAVMYMFAAAGFAYNKNKIKSPPQSWAEYFERAGKGEFGKSLSLPDIAYGWTPAFLWLYAKTFGGGVQQMDPAFDALRKINPYIVKNWATAAEVEKMLTTQEVDIAIFWDGRTHSLIDGGASFIGFQRPNADSLISGVVSQVVKGGNEKLALEYVNTLLDPSPQLKYFNRIQYAVTNRKVAYPPAVRDRIMPVERGVVAPYRELAAITPALIDRWNRELRG
ncbi:MAG: ABC transporter substrate-binding protein [Alphaproteobacteria bacterium]